MIRPEKIFINGISQIFRAVFFIRYPYSGIAKHVTIMVWLINNHGIIPVNSHGVKGNPLDVDPAFKPNVKANQITNT